MHSNDYGHHLYYYLHIVIVIVTVEDPSELFAEIRDKCDIRFLRVKKALEGLVAPVDKKVIDKLWKKWKFNKVQFIIYYIRLYLFLCDIYLSFGY